MIEIYLKIDKNIVRFNFIYVIDVYKRQLLQGAVSGWPFQKPGDSGYACLKLLCTLVLAISRRFLSGSGPGCVSSL